MPAGRPTTTSCRPCRDSRCCRRSPPASPATCPRSSPTRSPRCTRRTRSCSRCSAGSAPDAGSRSACRCWRPWSRSIRPSTSGAACSSRPRGRWAMSRCARACAGRSGPATGGSASCPIRTRTGAASSSWPGVPTSPPTRGYGTQQGRQQNLELVLGELARQLATRASAEWTAALGEADIPFAAVNDLEDLLHDPHLESVGFWQLLEHPTEGTAAPAGQPDRAVGDAAVHPAPAAAARRAHRRGAGFVRLRRGRHRTPGVRQRSLMDYDKNFALVTPVPPRISSWVARRKQS